MSRSADFWLHDGSIILSVENTLFRVHQTILVNHSQVFADLFSLPQPNAADGGDETIEGCRVVVLADDSAADFEDLLGAIYHPSHFDDLPADADLDVLLEFISGILRLSTKYIIPALRKRCISLLSARFPTTYEDYMASSPRPYTPSMAKSAGERFEDHGVVQDDTIATMTTPVTATYSTVTFSLAPTSPPTTLASSIYPVPSSSRPINPIPNNAAHPSPTIPPTIRHSRSRRHSSQRHDHHRNREQDHERSRDKPSKPTKPFKTPSIPSFPLPKSSSLMRTITLAQSTNVPTILPYLYYLLARTSSPRRFLSHSPTSLSWHQKTLVLVGRTHLHAAELSLSHAFLIAFEASPNCVTPNACRASRGPMMEWAMLCTTGRGPEPLRPWERWERLGVCERCVGHAKGKHERGRREVWERLPGFFEMGSWSRLGKTQDA
ncbi:hypothetical protein E4T56_gene11320 [Termitomyces sp. T112]|nr:hypothetical protein E4T56_gene11320 [Termitomyces sp. T112]